MGAPVVPFVTQAQPSAAVTVTDVHDMGDGTTVWTFSRTVASLSDVTGFTCNGEVPTLNSFGLTQVNVSYPTPPAAGDPWLFDSTNTDIAFSPPGVIGDQSGTVT
jgi:hypothetical protein